jgi:hypothetical protein
MKFTGREVISPGIRLEKKEPARVVEKVKPFLGN